MLKKIFLALLTALAALLLFATTRPDHFHLERSVRIQAPPEQVFAALQDFRRWTTWSPWEKKDPLMKREYSGAAQGVGAAYAWQGNSSVGSGRMEIIEAQPATRLLLRLEFLAPMAASNTATFTLTPQPQGGTEVVWAMDGPSPYLTKLLHLLVPIDRLVGPDFEQGLAQLKAVSEAGKTPAP